jgi:hypothetical protein
MISKRTKAEITRRKAIDREILFLNPIQSNNDYIWLEMEMILQVGDDSSRNKYDKIGKLAPLCPMNMDMDGFPRSTSFQFIRKY